MKLSYYAITCALLTISSCMDYHAKNHDLHDKEETLLCDRQRFAELRKDVKECWNLAYLNFLEEKLVNIEDNVARCNHLNFKV